MPSPRLVPRKHALAGCVSGISHSLQDKLGPSAWPCLSPPGYCSAQPGLQVTMQSAHPDQGAASLMLMPAPTCGGPALCHCSPDHWAWTPVHLAQHSFRVVSPCPVPTLPTVRGGPAWSAQSCIVSPGSGHTGPGQLQVQPGSLEAGPLFSQHSAGPKGTVVLLARSSQQGLKWGCHSPHLTEQETDTGGKQHVQVSNHVARPQPAWGKSTQPFSFLAREDSRLQRAQAWTREGRGWPAV